MNEEIVKTESEAVQPGAESLPESEADGTAGEAVLEDVPVPGISETEFKDTLPDVEGVGSTDMLDDNTAERTVSDGDSPADEFTDTNESGTAGSDEVDTSAVLYTYSEEQQQMDAAVLGSVNTLNGTCTLILFFLLFAWADKKVQAIMNGVTGK